MGIYDEMLHLIRSEGLRDYSPSDCIGVIKSVKPIAVDVRGIEGTFKAEQVYLSGHLYYIETMDETDKRYKAEKERKRLRVGDVVHCRLIDGSGLIMLDKIIKA